MKTDFYVYVLFRPTGEPCYVGKGSGDRWQYHFKPKAKHRNRHLQGIIRKAEAAGQKVECLKVREGMAEVDAFAIEAALIKFYGCAPNGLLVNLTDGGDGFSGGRHTAESKQRVSAALKAYVRTPEHSEALAKAHRGGTKRSGWWSTAEGRAKQKENNRGHTGHAHGAETKELLRRASIRQFASQRSRKAVQVSPRWAGMNSVRYHTGA